jgi:hypothetical protein
MWRWDYLGWCELYGLTVAGKNAKCTDNHAHLGPEEISLRAIARKADDTKTQESSGIQSEVGGWEEKPRAASKSRVSGEDLTLNQSDRMDILGRGASLTSGTSHICKDHLGYSLYLFFILLSSIYVAKISRGRKWGHKSLPGTGPQGVSTFLLLLLILGLELKVLYLLARWSTT